MFFTRRLLDLLPSEPLRQTRPVALALGLSAGLAACGGDEAPDTPETPPGQEILNPDPIIDIPVTQLFNTGGGGNGIGFLPDPDTVWAGHIVASGREGGIDVFDSFGEIVSRVEGGRINTLATAPDFALRGQALPLVFGVDAESNAVRAFAVARNSGGVTLFGLPIEPMAVEGGVSAVCRYGQGVGYVDIAVLGRLDRAAIYRVRDTGGDLVTAELRADFQLDAPARACVADGDDLILASPSAGLQRIDSSGAILARQAVSASNLAYGDFLGTPRLLVSTDEETIDLYEPATLERVGEVRLVEALSAPGVERPSAIAATRDNFGGAFRSGLVLVADRNDGRLRAVARDTFAVNMLAPGDPETAAPD